MPQSFISQQNLPNHLVYQGKELNSHIFELICKEHPGFSLQSYISVDELSQYRKQYLRSLVETEKGELSQLEKEVIESIAQDEILSSKLINPSPEKLSTGDRAADAIASFGGSWTFIIVFFGFLIVWMSVNVAMALFFKEKAFDPYPFILLNLMLSCLAAIQAPIIMMSQNRKEERDRLRAENDYKVNLKAELEIRLLHEKIDHLLVKQNQRLIDIQEMQTDLLNDILRKVK